MIGPATEGSVQQRVHRMSVGHDERLVVSCWRSVHRFSKPLSVCRPSVGLCVRVFFLFQKGRKIFLFNFF